MIYNADNIFAKILENKIPCKKFYEDEFVLSFPDINPLTSVHLLIIPKGSYVSFHDFSLKASPEELAGFFRAVGLIAKKAGVERSGYRLIANHGRDANQEVPHFHMHLLGGEPLGSMLGSRHR
ncbi:MAG: histidine triad nucleotide-binding protein [Alphaproteobacteria bacterium RIFCSPHIGHO2_01_FULL_41_14]|nr:MAG: histidine triad nucleotide-binding protein [Alphaproteobacteria bacterium GWB1_45_5]OFW76518.1 MAG: histidine triad nucleotide-binding protein [Alphaproteobacteria bacterium GWA1_45_9]OFW90310.1 MAG: histidine triad nucleotide-binding protein [Alphaproteobacteria bacterium RIFCSPHIGHO2_01_FULL_41_14]HCI48607.1 histidine triad nucleotide-binding protein [Holosporales bacterium]